MPLFTKKGDQPLTKTISFRCTEKEHAEWMKALAYRQAKNLSRDSREMALQMLKFVQQPMVVGFPTK